MLEDHQSNPPSRWHFSRRLMLAIVREPAHRRSRSILIVTGLVIFIGWVYYASDGLISLQPIYFIPIALSTSWLGLRAGLITALMCTFVRTLGGDLARAEMSFFTAEHLVKTGFNRLSGLMVYLCWAILMHEFVALHRQLEERVKLRTTALKQAIASRDRLQNILFEVGRRERSAIGHDLHDGLGQHLTATSIAATMLARRLSSQNNPAAPDARMVESLVKEGIDKTRMIARGLLLENIQPEELVAELGELATTVTHEQKTPCVFTAHGLADGLDVNTASHLFYIAQEAVRNALRHGEPTQVAIQFVAEPTNVSLTVTDNGRGVPSGLVESKGMGLHIMAHRAELIGGRFSIQPAPKGGTKVDCRVPLSLAAAI